MFTRWWREFRNILEFFRPWFEFIVILSSLAYVVVGCAGWLPWGVALHATGGCGAIMVTVYVICIATMPFAVQWNDGRDRREELVNRRLELQCKLERLRQTRAACRNDDTPVGAVDAPRSTAESMDVAFKGDPNFIEV